MIINPSKNSYCQPKNNFNIDGDYALEQLQ